MNKRLREACAIILALSALAFFAAPAAQAQASLTRSAIIAQANDDRARAGTDSLFEDALLDKAAQAKADDMAERGYFSHLDPSGNAPWYWFKKLGYYYWGAGENLAINFSDAQSLESAWMQSPTHRANIMQKSYSRVGVGIAQGTYQGKPATFIVQFFANPYIAPAIARR